MGLRKINLEDCKQILRHIYYDGRDEYVPYLISTPGIGKTETVHQLGNELEVDVYEIVASQCDPTEISGMAMPDNEHKLMTIYDNDILANMKDGDILFLDEFDKAQPEVQAAILKLLQERRMRSGRKLNDVLIVAAGNDNIEFPERTNDAVRERFLYMHITYCFANWQSHVKEVLGITPHQKWDSIIQGDNKQEWNDCTPRDAFKLLKLWQQTIKHEDKNKKDVVEKMITAAWEESCYMLPAIVESFRKAEDEQLLSLIQNESYKAMGHNQVRYNELVELREKLVTRDTCEWLSIIESWNKWNKQEHPKDFENYNLLEVIANA